MKHFASLCQTSPLYTLLRSFGESKLQAVSPPGKLTIDAVLVFNRFALMLIGGAFR